MRNFESGTTKIINGDCLEVMRRYHDNYFDLAIVDPPYGIDGNSHRENKSRGKVAKSKDYHNALWGQEIPTEEYFKELVRVSKHQIIWGINYFKSEHLNSAGRIIWDKCNGETSFSDAEIAYSSMFYSTRMVHYMWSGMMQGKTIGRDSSVMNGKKDLNEKRIHPTQKPIILYNWIYEKFANKEMKVIDTHLGSGSSAISGHYFGFEEFVGIEIDETYFNDCVQRFIQMTPPTPEGEELNEDNQMRMF